MGMKPIEILYLDVDRNSPIKEKVNDWYSERQPTNTSSVNPVRQKIKDIETALVVNRTLFNYNIWDP